MEKEVESGRVENKRRLNLCSYLQAGERVAATEMRSADSRCILENWLVAFMRVMVMGEKFEDQSALVGKEIGPTV